MSPFTILGIKSNADIDTAQKAYRKLASKLHPDHGGNETEFKQVKAAWEAIEGGYRDQAQATSSFTQGFSNSRPRQKWTRPEPPAGAWHAKEDINDIFEEMKKANREAPNGTSYRQPQPSDELVSNVSMREAFAGYSMIVPKHHRGGMITNSTVHVPAGTPHGYRHRYQTSNNDLVTITTRISTGDFHLRGFDDQDNLFSAGLNIGDVELEHDIHAIDIVLGGWIKTRDFLGEVLTVRVPAGFNPLHRLKIAGKGFYGWDPLAGAPLLRRQDMYLRLRPLYTKLDDLETEKVINLYKAVQAMVPKDES